MATRKGSKLGLIRRGKRLAFSLLPPIVRLRLGRIAGPRDRTASPNVSDVVSREIQDGVRLDVYWLRAPLGSGPAASLYVFGEEVVRLDCLPQAVGHLHTNVAQWSLITPGRDIRQYLPPAPVEAHIERAEHEIAANIPFATGQSLRRKIRNLQVDPSCARAAATWMGDRMRELVATHATDGTPG